MPCLEWVTFAFDSSVKRGIELEAIEEIKSRCEAAGLDYEEIEGEWTFLWDAEGAQEVFSDIQEGGKLSGLSLKIPRGRDFYSVFVQEGASAEWILSEPFEEFKKLKGYEASWSPTRRVIECNLTPCDPAKAIFGLLKRRYVDPDSETRAGLDKRRTFESSAPYSISTGYASNVHTFLEGGVVTTLLEGSEEVRVQRSLTLRIEGIEATTHDNAVDVLEGIGDSFCFQQDLLTNLAVMLEREYIPKEVWSSEQLKDNLKSPIRYDHEAMSLYWYAKAAEAMPLFQFLAYYQVLEFYFPRYSQIEAHDALRNLWNDPRFDPSRSTDIERLVRAAQSGIGGRGFGNEESQLAATIHHCVTADDLRTFLISEDENRYRFFTSDNAKKLTKAKLQVREDSADHRGSVAKRVYKIRNRIVHTKSGQEDERPLFPFDSQIKYLKYDIQLVEFLAQKVLIASSRPLQT